MTEGISTREFGSRGWEKKDAKHAHWLRARRYTTGHYRVITNVPRFLREFEINPFLDDPCRAYTRVFRERFGVKSTAANKKIVHIHYGYEDHAEMNREGSEPQPRATPAFIIGGATLGLHEPSPQDSPNHYAPVKVCRVRGRDSRMSASEAPRRSRDDYCRRSSSPRISTAMDVP